VARAAEDRQADRNDQVAEVGDVCLRRIGEPVVEGQRVERLDRVALGNEV
jgi:hypothetical protein